MSSRREPAVLWRCNKYVSYDKLIIPLAYHTIMISYRKVILFNVNVNWSPHSCGFVCLMYSTYEVGQPASHRQKYFAAVVSHQRKPITVLLS